MSSASSYHTHRRNPSGFTGLHVSGLFKNSLTWSPSIKDKPSLLKTFSQVSEAWDFWRLVLQVKTEAKQQQAHVFPGLPCAGDTPIEILAALHISLQIQLHMGFGFPNPTLAHSGSVSLFFLSYPQLLSPIECFLYVSDFWCKLFLSSV